MLMQPPDTRKAFDNNQIVHRLFHAMKVVKQLAFAKDMLFALSLVRSWEQIFGMIIVDSIVVDRSPGVPNQFTACIVKWNRDAILQHSP